MAVLNWQKSCQIVKQGGLGPGVKVFCNQSCVLDELMAKMMAVQLGDR